MSEQPATIRLDKWLWHARFFKTRPMAAGFIAEGRIRIDGRPVEKPGYAVRPGNTLVFPQGPHVRSVRIVLCGVRRGPAPEARTLYEDLDPPEATHA